MPFCGVAVVEQLCGARGAVEDSYLEECLAKGYHACQPHQAAVVDAVAALVGLTGMAGVEMQACCRRCRASSMELQTA